MSRILSELMGAAEPGFSFTLRDLESASGGLGLDIKLSTDIRASVRQKTKELGLDPNDSNGKELYHALLMLAKIHDEHLAKALGATDLTDVHDLLGRIKTVPEKLAMPRMCWGIKHSVAKRMLVEKPPKNIMKLLGYRSVDSLLKRENVGEIYSALVFCEDEQWLRRFKALLYKLAPSDFETREIEIVTLDAKRWGRAAESFVSVNGHNLCINHEMGAILLLPLPLSHLKGLTITVLPLLLEAINEIRMYSALFRLRQVRPDFGEIVAAAVSHDVGESVNIAGQPVHFRVLHKHFGSKQAGPHLEIFEPHLSLEDLSWRKAEEVLFRLEPSLDFWRGLEYVGTKQDELPVSFNMLDIAVSLVNNLEYGEHSVYYLQESLWNELLMRYMGNKNIEDQVLSQLEDDMLEPSTSRRPALAGRKGM